MVDEIRKDRSPVSTPLSGQGMAKDAEKEDTPEKKEERPSLRMRLKAMWKKTGLNPAILLIMAKGGLPPTIILAMCESTTVADIYTTLSYLAAIISILCFAVMPRALFIQTMFLNLVAVCLAAAFGLLEIYCAVEARRHTTPGGRSPNSTVGPPTPGVHLVTYNSSASAVAAIWLLFQIYVINTIRAKNQQYFLPSIHYSIYVLVVSMYAPQIPLMSAGIAFTKRLLESFLTGFAVATGVSLFVVPITSRQIVFRDFTNYFAALQGSLNAHRAYIHNLEEEEGVNKSFMVDIKKPDDKNPKATGVKVAISAILAIHGKLQADLTFAKREVAFGKLGPDDLNEMNKLIRLISLPVMGLGSMVNIFERVAESEGWTEEHIKEGLSPEAEEARRQIMSDWQFNMKLAHGSLDGFVELMIEGIDHINHQLELKKLPKPKSEAKKDKDGNATAEEQDIEANAQSTKPGDEGFAEYFEQKSKKLHEGKPYALTQWCARKGMALPKDFFERSLDTPFKIADLKKTESKDVNLRYHRQLYMILYMEFLLHSSTQAILNFIRFADEKVKSGKMSKKRLIFPGIRRLGEWMMSLFKDENDNMQDHMMADVQASTSSVYMGQAYDKKRDPEHLPPANAWEKFGDGIRSISGFLKSPESSFGFRVTAATMSISIVAYLHQSQIWFTENRLLWASIMVAISMNPTAGQSMFGFTLRVGGTAIAMVVSFLVYYIPGGKTAGILVFLWFFSSCGYYIVLKYPSFTVVGTIAIVTISLIIGYELEVRKIGAALATSNGQTYLPVYKLAPYRLAAVAGGLLLAYIWTIFPYPITEHSALRQDLGRAVYLLANFYSVVHETVHARIRRDEGDVNDHQSPGYKLQKARRKVFSKTSLIIASLKDHLAFLKWEFPIGGKFPKEQYAVIIECVERIVNYMALIGYASQDFANNDEDSESKWSEDFRRLVREAHITTHEITTILSLLSSSIKNGRPLPPYLKTPKPYRLSETLLEMDSDILSVRHINESGYAALAVVQICSRCVLGDLDKLLKAVREIVGELDFSFHIVSTASQSTESIESLDSQGSDKRKND